VPAPTGVDRRLIHYQHTGEFFLYDPRTETKYLVSGVGRDRVALLSSVERVDGPPVEDALIAVTDVCNERCRHCSTGEPKGHHLELPLLRSLLRDLKGLGVLRVYLTGGEILTRKDLFPLLDEVAANGYTIQLGTNGTLLSPETVARLERYPVTLVSISVDGALAVTHDEFRGVAGAHAAALEGLRALSESRLACRAITVLHRGVLPELALLHELLARYSLREWLLSEVFLLGRAVANREAIVPGFEEVAEAIEGLRTRVSLEGPPFRVTGYLVDALARRRGSREPLCDYPEMARQFYVCPNGDVLKDTLHGAVVGNIREGGPRDLWDRAEDAWTSRPAIPLRCPGCLAGPYCVTLRQFERA
jgi:AdoMet-dependent heme synthase